MRFLIVLYIGCQERAYSCSYLLIVSMINDGILYIKSTHHHQLQRWLFNIGYTLAFGSVFAKMWRVGHIFNNPQPNIKVCIVLYTLGANSFYYYSMLCFHRSRLTCIWYLLCCPLLVLLCFCYSWEKPFPTWGMMSDLK